MTMYVCENPRLVSIGETAKSVQRVGQIKTFECRTGHLPDGGPYNCPVRPYVHILDNKTKDLVVSVSAHKGQWMNLSEPPEEFRSESIDILVFGNKVTPEMIQQVQEELGLTQTT